MTVVRLRDYPDAAELASMYAVAHDYRQWVDHHLRADITVAMGNSIIMQEIGISSAADLSCGNGMILAELDVVSKHYGDMGDTGDADTLRGPLHKTIYQIPPVDLYVLSETIEHVESPIDTLKLIRDRARYLLLSTPCGELESTGNPEHVWGWDRDGMESLLMGTGWTPRMSTIVNLRPHFVYDYQIWVCQ